MYVWSVQHLLAAGNARGHPLTAPCVKQHQRSHYRALSSWHSPTESHTQPVCGCAVSHSSYRGKEAPALQACASRKPQRTKQKAPGNLQALGS